MKERQAYIDFGSGIMILYVVLFHALQCAWTLEDSDAVNPMLVFPYLSFFMPWFFYKSGLFFEKKGVKELWQKDSRKLLRTFVVWSAIGYVFYLVFNLLQHTLTFRGATYSVLRGFFLTGKIPVNAPLWFLLTLLGVRAIANITLPDKEDKWCWLKVLGLSVIGYVIAYLSYRINYRLLPYWIANGASGFAFFVLGYGLRDYESKWWLVISCALVYMSCCVFGFPIVSEFSNTLRSGNYLLWIPSALCGIITYNTICRILYKQISFAPLEFVGQNAMIIYISHMLLISMVAFVLIFWQLEFLLPYALWVILTCCALIIPILCVINYKINSRKAVCSN